MTANAFRLGPAQARTLLTLSLEPRRFMALLAESHVCDHSRLSELLRILEEKELAVHPDYGLWALGSGRWVDEALDDAWTVLYGAARADPCR